MRVMACGRTAARSGPAIRAGGVAIEVDSIGPPKMKAVKEVRREVVNTPREDRQAASIRGRTQHDGDRSGQ